MFPVEHSKKTAFINTPILRVQPQRRVLTHLKQK